MVEIAWALAIELGLNLNLIISNLLDLPQSQFPPLWKWSHICHMGFIYICI